MPQWLGMWGALGPLPISRNAEREWERQQPAIPTKGILKGLKPWCDLTEHSSTESSFEYSSPLPHVHGHNLPVSMDTTCSSAVTEHLKKFFRLFGSYKPLGTTQNQFSPQSWGMPNNLYQLDPDTWGRAAQCWEANSWSPLSFQSSSYNALIRVF